MEHWANREANRTERSKVNESVSFLYVRKFISFKNAALINLVQILTRNPYKSKFNIKQKIYSKRKGLWNVLNYRILFVPIYSKFI